MIGHRWLLIVFLILLSLVASSQPAEPLCRGVEQRASTLREPLTVEEKIDVPGGVDDIYIRGNKRIGLPRLKISDGPAGVRGRGPATTVGGIGLAAIWNPDLLVHRMGDVIGQDARARGVHFRRGRGVNIYRTPRCGRNFSRKVTRQAE